MLTVIRAIALLGLVGLICWVIYETTKKPYLEPCDYSGCEYCPFPCEMHEKKKGGSFEPPESEV